MKDYKSNSKDSNDDVNFYLYLILAFLSIIGVCLIITCIYRYKYIGEKKRIRNMLEPHLVFKNTLSYNKQDRYSVIANFANAYDMVRSLSNLETRNSSNRFVLRLSNGFAKKLVVDIHFYLAKIIKNDYLDLNATTYGFKTPDELYLYLMRGYSWRRLELQRSLYFFAVYFNGISILCYNLLDSLNDRYEGEIVNTTIANLSLLRLKYSDLLYKYINIQQNTRILARSNDYRLEQTIGFYGPSAFKDEDFVELERCFVAFVKIFAKKMDVLYNQEEELKI